MWHWVVAQSTCSLFGEQFSPLWEENTTSTQCQKGLCSHCNNQDNTSRKKIFASDSLLQESHHYKQGSKATLKLISIPSFSRGEPHIFADKHAHVPWIFSAPKDSSLTDLPGLLWATWHVIAATHIWKRHF